MQKTIKSKRTLRILHVIGYMDMGGAETFLMNILRNINTDTYDFTFLCFTERSFDYEPELVALGAKIIRIPGIKKGGIFKNIGRMMRIMRDEKIDVVHAHIFFDSVFSLFAAKLAGVRLRVNHSHSTKFENSPSIIKRSYFLTAKILSNAFSNYRIACSEEAGRALFGKRSGFDVLYNGIDLQKFYFNLDDRNEVRKSLGLSDDHRVVLHVGRFDVEKNHEFLIDVFKLYAEKNPTSKLLLIGDGPLRTTVMDKVRTYGLGSRVIFLGKRADVSRYYSASDVFLLPSYYEGLGMVLIEAQSNGLYAIASDGVPPAVNLTGRVAFLQLGAPVSSWVRTVGDMAMDMNGRTDDYSFALRDYEIDAVSRKLTKIYDKVLI